VTNIGYLGGNAGAIFHRNENNFNMLIREVTLFPLRIPLYRPFVISLGPLTHAENLFVRIRTADGREGWGETSPFPTIHGEFLTGAVAAARFLAPLLIGLPANLAPAYTARLNRALHGNTAVKSALDMACHDLAAHEADLPLYQYLGGTTPPEMRTDYTVSLGPAAEMVADAVEIAGRGFPVIKLKLGAGAEADLDRVQRIRAALGSNLPLRLDANQGWTFEEANWILPRLGGLGIQHCEAPIDRYEWTRLPELRKSSAVPLMADESCWNEDDARRLLAIGGIDRINIKISKAGSLLTARRIIDRTDVPLQVGGFLESRLGFTAAAQLAASSDRVAYYDFDTPLMQTEDPVEGGITYGSGGLVTLPEGPGLGARLRSEYQLPSSPQNTIT
jgi:L-alanine-DL-glutamate epimerase-like enolase superfamily enzyme